MRMGTGSLCSLLTAVLGLADPPRPLPLEGTIRGPDGKGIAGVVVEAGEACAISDASGRYLLEGLPRKVVPLSLRRGNVRFSSFPIRIPGPVALDIALPGGCSIRGRVMDGDTGKAVTGAVIRFSIGFPGRLPGGAAVEAVSGAEGRFSLEDLPPGRLSGELRILKEGYLEGCAWPDAPLVPADPVERVFRLGRGRTVRGRVVGEDGAPVPGAWVWYRREGFSAIVQPRTMAVPEDGSFEFHVDPGVHGTLNAWAPGFEIPGRPGTGERGGFPPYPAFCIVDEDEGNDVVRNLVLRRTPPGGEGRDRRILEESRKQEDRVLAERRPWSLAAPVPRPGPGPEPDAAVPAASLRGVVRSVDGDPVAGAWVLLAPAGGSPHREIYLHDSPVAAVTDAKGGFEVRGLVPGQAPVRVLARGFLDAGAAGEAGGEPVTVSLRPACSVSGRAVREGVPLAGLAVTATAPSGRDLPFATRPFPVATDSDGRFRIEGLSDGAWNLEVAESWYAPLGELGAHKGTTVMGGETGWTIEVPRAGPPKAPPPERAKEGGLWIRGRILDEAGLAHGYGSVSGGEIRSAATGEKGTSLRIFTDGTFTAGPHPAGTKWDLRIHGTMEHLGVWVRGVEAGARDVVLPLRRGGTISGRVLDAATGLPVKGIEVHADPVDAPREEPNLHRSATTDAAGEFRIRGLGPWKFNVDAARWSGRFLPEEASGVHGDGAFLEFRLKAAPGK